VIWLLGRSFTKVGLVELLHYIFPLFMCSSVVSSRCPESQREAALLLGQFATTDPECKVHIVQRGAVRPLIRMLEASDPQLREMAAFALGRLAQVLIAVALVSALTENLVFLSLQSAEIVTLVLIVLTEHT
jgi:hypothetical protein